MRKTKIVEIQIDGEEKKRVFTMKELTCEQIINLSQTSAFFSDSDKNGENEEGVVKEEAPVNHLEFSPAMGIMEELKDFGMELTAVMQDTCDFTLDDLRPLTPSEIREVWDGFREVNQDFFDVLEKLGLMEVLGLMVKRATSGFSAIAAVL